VKTTGTRRRVAIIIVAFRDGERVHQVVRKH
jgi:hypothetical protein